MRILSVSLFVLFLICSCGTDRGAIEGIVSAVCRSRVEGDFESYRKHLGGVLLRNALLQPAVRSLFDRQAVQYKKSGTLFVEIYIREIRVLQKMRRATISFIEKLSLGSRTVTFSRLWYLEKVDKKWRVIRL